MLAILCLLLGGLGACVYVAMRSHRRSEELRHKLTELGESRKRIIEAQDRERRRIERDIHDGAQQRLVSMSVKLGLAKQTLADSPGKAAEVLDDLRRDTGDVLETLRDLARGLFPPILEDRGLASALQALVDRRNLGVIVKDELEEERLGLETEAGVYFAIREALEHAGKDVEGMGACVRLWSDEGHLHFELCDLGRGFDAGGSSTEQGLRKMEDRLGALHGELWIHDSPGEATVIRGKVPYHKT